jgi:hypothetical protein
MARFRVVHSDDAATILIAGDKRNPEPTSAIIKFPGGVVEVSRTSDGNYWVHASCFGPGEESPGQIIGSRIDYARDAYHRNGGEIPPIPAHADIEHMALLIARKVE